MCVCFFGEIVKNGVCDGIFDCGDYVNVNDVGICICNVFGVIFLDNKVCDCGFGVILSCDGKSCVCFNLIGFFWIKDKDGKYLCGCFDG